MPTGLADLLHDAAVLHGFVDFIEAYCREQERSQTYVDSSGLFFLGGHLKTGQSWTLQNRPVDRTQNNLVLHYLS